MYISNLRERWVQVQHMVKMKKKYSAKELSSFVLKKMVDNFEKSFGKVDEVIITIPANFTNEAREDTLRSGKIAGMKVKKHYK